MLDYQRSDGKPAAVEVVLQPVDLPGSSRAIVAIARDIRERIEVQVRLQRLAQAEHARAAELNAVIRAMGEAVVVCAADGTITLTNPAGERLFPDVDERTYAEILDQLNDPDGDRAASRRARRPGRAPDPGGSRSAGSSSRPIRSTSGSAVRRAARRSSSCAT